MADHPEVLETRSVADLTPLLEGWTAPYSIGIGLDGAIYAAGRRSAEPLREEYAHASFAKSQLEQPTDYHVLRWQDGHVQTLVLPGERIAIGRVQPLAGGVLLVGGRCWWEPDGPERNAIAVGWDGEVRARFTLGDGIQDVRVAPDDTIWVSYFDEGVFGNYGWGGPGPAPIGMPGLVAFGPTGERCFAYDPRAARLGAITDVYAMNVAAEGDVWLYYYTGFPIVRIQRGTYHAWSPGIRGARALAVRGSRVLLLGDYDHPGLGRLIELGKDGAAQVAGERTLVDEHGRSLAGAAAWGVGGALFLFDEGRVLVAEDW